MVTGASTADVAVILLDARQGVVEQTRRHAYIASILEIPHVVFAVNKMDLVDFSQERFEEIVVELEDLNAQLGPHDPKAIPMSALRGDNVVEGCEESMPWWNAPPLLEFFEQIEISTDRNLGGRHGPVWAFNLRTRGAAGGRATLVLKDIALFRRRLSEPLCVDLYAENRETGAFILIDEATNDTVGAGMIVSATP